MSDVNDEAMAAMIAAAPLLHNGLFTVSHPTRPHYTVKIHTAQRGKLKGERIISILTGPDNLSSYTAVAFWDDRAGLARVWKKYAHGSAGRGLDGREFLDTHGGVEAKINVLLSLALPTPEGDEWRAKDWRIDRASRCVKCNRLLTTPESLSAGVGPTCAARS